MPQQAGSTDSETYFLFVFVIVAIAVGFILRAIFFSNGFIHELKYLNSEIKRTTGRERRYYRRRRRRLWLSILPFIKY